MNESRIIETGIVAARTDLSIEIRLAGSDACARCGLCGHGADGSRLLTVKAPEAPLEPGSRVKIILPYRSVWRQALVVFVSPLVLMLCGAFAGAALAAQFESTAEADTLLSVAGALAGLGTGALMAVFSERRFRRRLWEDAIVEPAGGG